MNNAGTVIKRIEAVINTILKKYIPSIIKLHIKNFLISKSTQASQFGQDYWVYGEVFNQLKKGYFLEIGAYDGVKLSNTYLLEKRYGWNGICIEANPYNFQKLIKNRNSICVNACIDKKEGEVDFIIRDLFSGICSLDTDNKNMLIGSCKIIKMRTTTLGKLLEEYKAPKEIDYLSIDVEGAEERILSQFDFNRYKFKCITIERPAQSIRTLLKKFGYLLIKDTPGFDCYYIHSSFLNKYTENLLKFNHKKYFALRWK